MKVEQINSARLFIQKANPFLQKANPFQQKANPFPNPSQKYPQSVATIGFFDGVHRGHRFLIEQVQTAARRRGLATSVVTFPIHPRRVMHPDFRPSLLTTCEEKVSLLSATGIDYCVMSDFTPEVANLSAREFMAILKRQYQIAALVIGYDHRFGHNRSEGFDDYVRYGSELGMEVIQAMRLEAPSVSSSVIRNLLREGNVTEASMLLGYDYFLQGTVVGGYRVGRKIGYPTANLHVTDADKLIPADGVYAVRVSLEGKEYGGMCSIGCRPTMDNGTDRSIEVHIFGYDGDAYQQPMRLNLIRRTRTEQKFDTVEALMAQLHQDEAEIKHILSQ